MTIDLPAQAVVIVVAGRDRDRAIELCERIDAHPEPWSVNQPDDSAVRLERALAEHDLVRVFINRSHAAARRKVASIARRNGYASVCLRLPDGPTDVDVAAERIGALHDVAVPAETEFRIVPTASDRRDVAKADMIGDVHGCIDELRDLLTELGHLVDGVPRPHPEGRVPVFLGDYTDRGPANAEVLALVRAFTGIGALALRGNHDAKLKRWLEGRDVRVEAGLAGTIAELEGRDDQWKADTAAWIGGMPTHLVLDGGRLVVAHAGLAERYHGRHTAGAESFALYGEHVRNPDGSQAFDEHGHPLTADWAQDYRGEAVVVHGHVVHEEPREVNGVVALDQGCVFGGALSGYRWPEREFFRIPARRTYCEPEGRALGGDAA